MKERPILFSAPMVRAILEGRKTQTRRVFKVRGPMGNLCEIISPDEEIIRMGDGSFHYLSTGGMSGPYPCPYGAPGDLLWVRETFRERPQDQDGNCTEYRADRPEYVKRDDDPSAIHWTPSIHMPRWASRITLKVTDVRVERLQDITNRDAIAEGLTHVADGGTPWGIPGLPVSWSEDPRVSFWGLWDSINADTHPWLSNPWVWVVGFERVQP